MIQAERFLAAVRDGDRPRARRLLQRHPDLAGADLWCAAAAGAVTTVAAILAARPEAATSPHPGDGWPPLLYTAATPLLPREPAATALRRTAELLLDHGADANSQVPFAEGDPPAPLAALYFACERGQAPVAALLLARGADPNDGESIYHAAEHDRRDCLELLAAHGADLSGAHPHWGNTPLYFLAGYRESHPHIATVTAGMRWLLEHGVDPNVPSTPRAETPLHRIAALGRGPAVAAMAELLLAHGADADRRRADGRGAHALAVRAGNVEVAELLRRHGVDRGEIAPLDELLGACLRGDGAAAHALVMAHPALLAGLTEEDRQTAALAAEDGRIEAVRLLAEMGFDLRWEGLWGGTPLHHAAWRANLPLVRLLLELGAPVDLRDRTYGCSPLGWAAHGSANHPASHPINRRRARQVTDEYIAVVDALLAAGSRREEATNRWGVPPEEMATRPVAAHLRAAWE